MQDIDVKKALERGYLPAPFSPLVTHGFLDLGDLAAVAVAILRARPSVHARTRYELVGDLASYRDVAQWLSESARMPINVERLERDLAVRYQVQNGRLKDAFGCEAFARMISYYEAQYVRICLNSLSKLRTTLTRIFFSPVA
jgi:nucleoside-diphosphate-sugar epimerase